MILNISTGTKFSSTNRNSGTYSGICYEWAAAQVDTDRYIIARYASRASPDKRCNRDPE